VTPVVVPEIADASADRAFALSWARQRGLVKAGDRVVMVLGTLPGDPAHNAIHVEVVGDS
jgi:hypothetical protein